MDRNYRRFGAVQHSQIDVALRKESVDRNRSPIKCGIAWIKVALRKESVDRNIIGQRIGIRVDVALRKESVDRNKRAKPTKQTKARRSPQGERG